MFRFSRGQSSIPSIKASVPASLLNTSHTRIAPFVHTLSGPKRSPFLDPAHMFFVHEEGALG